MENFIGSFQIDEKDLSVCDEIINFFHTNDHLHEAGHCINKYTHKPEVLSEVKKSTDIVLDFEMSQDCLLNYFSCLEKCLNEYIKKFPLCNAYSEFRILEPPMIQWYKPNEAFFQYHCERGYKSPRHLAFMTYLNDVEDGGGTEFYHQKITLKCKKGLTTFWPVDWTYTHRGIPSKTQDKYIITGWYSFI